MRTDFQFVALARENFAHLFSMDDAELAHHGAKRMTVDSHPGYPCRISLQDAPVGETVILTPFQHHAVNSPYQAAGPIFVRERAATVPPEINAIPVMFHHRLLSVRAYDESALMKAAKVVAGETLEATIRDFFSDPDITYLHVHNAAPGCFNCLVQRAAE